MDGHQPPAATPTLNVQIAAVILASIVDSFVMHSSWNRTCPYQPLSNGDACFLRNFFLSRALANAAKTTSLLNWRRHAPRSETDRLESYRREVGGPRDGSGGAVTDAMWAAAIGCRACAKGENFSN
jgi:hypothetical protein